jgi:hypothetical protein
MSELTDKLRRPIENPIQVSLDAMLEAADALEAQEALIADLTESLVWAMQRHAEPRLILGQNEDYYNAWRKASKTLSKAPSIK